MYLLNVSFKPDGLNFINSFIVPYSSFLTFLTFCSQHYLGNIFSTFQSLQICNFNGHIIYYHIRCTTVYSSVSL